MTDKSTVYQPRCFMASLSPIRNVSEKRFGDGILVEFADGRCAIYSDSLFYATMPQAVEVKNAEPSVTTPSPSRRVPRWFWLPAEGECPTAVV
jgi:hypothetical protein